MNHYKTQVEIAETFGVSRPAVHKWLNSPGFPDKQKHGWSKDAVTAWVAAKNQREQERAEATGDKAEKTRLECERLRVSIKREEENLKQAKLETARQSKKLHDVAECDVAKSRDAAALRGVIEAWLGHNTAKRPELREILEEVYTSLLSMLEAVE